MIPFEAYSYNGFTYIGDDANRTGEMLLRYLQIDTEPIAQWYSTLNDYMRRLMHAHTVKETLISIEGVQSIVTYVDELLLRLPVYGKLAKQHDRESNRVIGLYEKYSVAFDYMLEEEDRIVYNRDKNRFQLKLVADEFSASKRESIREKKQYYESFDYMRSLEKEYDEDDEAGRFIKGLRALISPYLTLLKDLMRVGTVYTAFLDDYVHKEASLPNEVEVAQMLTAFEADYPGMLAPAQNTVVSYKNMPVQTADGIQNALCETVQYSSLGPFLYNELMKGLLSGNVPKRCKNCGQYFLLTSGYNTNYCENTAPDEETKTCREVGARKRFDEKVKNDPVWLAYQRAYKAHYARVLKKKMTKPEFSEWADMAMELRTKALNKEIDFDEYAALIKK